MQILCFFRIVEDANPYKIESLFVQKIKGCGKSTPFMFVKIISEPFRKLRRKVYEGLRFSFRSMLSFQQPERL